MNLDHFTRPATVERMLIAMQDDAANTDAQRWLRQRSRAITRAYDEMMAEKEEEARRAR
jgi:hypothetical protein